MQGGLTKEQTEQIRLHIEACDQQIERLQNQLKSLRPDNEAASAAGLERQLDDTLHSRAELETLLRTLEQTPGATKEQTELIRQRIEACNQRIERLRTQLKALRP